MAARGVFLGVVQPQEPHLVVYERVLCLECGWRYAKPAGGGTSRDNPGCPRCGYVGWIAVRLHGTGGSRPGRLRDTG